MRIKAIVCEALHREFCLAAAYTPNVVDYVILDFGLHNTPDKLREAIQHEVDLADSGKYDAVVLGYGLCSRGTADVKAGSIPLVLVRAHDCITILLGARSRYDEEFRGNPGTYYYSSGWIERKEGESDQGDLNDVWERHYAEKLAEYIEKYGEDNAEFLLEQEKMWLVNYNRAVFIDTGLGDVAQYRRFVSELAHGRGWKYAEIEGNLSLVTRLISGSWQDDPDLLVVSPGKRITESFNTDIVRCSE